MTRRQTRQTGGRPDRPAGNKAGIVEAVAEAMGLSRREALAAFEAMLETIKEALAQGDRIELRGFGVFETTERKSGIGRNMQTGEAVPVPPRRTVRFKAGKKLRELPLEGEPDGGSSRSDRSS